MRPLVNALSIIGLLGVTSCAVGPDLPQDDFPCSFSEAPFVHPRIIQDLSTWLSDTGDQIVSVNLLDSQGSNRYHGDIEVKEVENENPFVFSKKGEETFGYSYVGMASNGIHVLLTTYSGGGSGTFTDLLLVTLERDMGLSTDRDRGTIQFNRPRLLIKKLGHIPLGDRWNGEVQVEGNRLFIGKDEGLFEKADWNSDQRLVGWHDLGAYRVQR